MVEHSHLASTEWVDIVSEDNEVIAQASREQMRAQRLRHGNHIIICDVDTYGDFRRRSNLFTKPLKEPTTCPTKLRHC